MLNGNAKQLYAACNQQVLLMAEQKYKQSMSLNNLPMTLLG